MHLMPRGIVGTDVVLAYGAKVALDSSSFEVPAGSLTVLIGPNGSGKSTMLSAFAGLVVPVRGRIEFTGSEGTRPSISYVLQATKVNEGLPVTTREVVSMGRYPQKRPLQRLGRHDRDAVDTAMGLMGLDDLAHRHLRELSGGQRQRVLVAQGLAQEHDILLLDEPLTGLDMPSAERIDAIIHDEQSKGRTVVVSTHDLAEARVADHVILLAGRVVGDGAPSEVLTRDHLNAAYGPSLLHVDSEVDMVIDDPAHMPVPGRHVHRERTIHVEGSEANLHE
jgi:iron complex transport system ATP-binding protein